jgi:dTDP-4-amino-4,6-dideoxygalactose transaminase
MIPFNKIHLTGEEKKYIQKSHEVGNLSGDGFYTSMCSEWLVKHTKTNKAFLTHSCTGALEMSALLADIKPGDEVIMPSYTFVSTANAFVLRGAIPVFIDIREDTLNINEKLIESAIT